MSTSDLSELYDTIQDYLTEARTKHEALNAAFDDLAKHADELEALRDETRKELDDLRQRIKAVLA